MNFTHTNESQRGASGMSRVVMFVVILHLFAVAFSLVVIETVNVLRACCTRRGTADKWNWSSFEVCGDTSAIPLGYILAPCDLRISSQAAHIRHFAS